MKGLKEAYDRLLWFLKNRTGRSLSRGGGRSTQANPQSQSVQASLSSSGSWSSSADLRAVLEFDKYAKLAETFDTGVLQERGWLRCLRGAGEWQSINRLNKDTDDCEKSERSCRLLASRLYDLTSHFAAEYNQSGHLLISMTAPSEVSEKRKVSKAPGAAETTESIVYTRWRASTASWALSCRTRFDALEIFLLPASDLMALSQAEAPLRLKLRLDLFKVNDRFIWTRDSMPVSAEDLRVWMRMFFRDLVCATQDNEQPVQSSSLSSVDDARLARSIEQLMFERENLAQKVVIQQEEIQKRIARDLHDAVISDVMALKRNIGSSVDFSTEESLKSLEIIVTKLREICYDLSPRDLSDWGLATVVEDMLDGMAQRTGIDCILNCDIDVPVMPAAVLLHIYRIIQESLNNAEKYAEPSKVAVTMEKEKEQFIVTVADNGKGFDLDSGKDKSRTGGGYGMGSLKERADLIRCFYPTKFYLSSAPGKGTRVRLEISLTRF